MVNEANDVISSWWDELTTAEAAKLLADVPHNRWPDIANIYWGQDAAGRLEIDKLYCASTGSATKPPVTTGRWVKLSEAPIPDAKEGQELIVSGRFKTSREGKDQHDSLAQWFVVPAPLKEDE